MAGIIAIALVIAARNLRPGETEFLISIIRWPAAIAAVPALWLCIQVLPLRLLEHSIWKSAETALGHPLVGSISIDIGATAIALGQYLSIAAVAFLSAAVAVDRLRADWILFCAHRCGRRNCADFAFAWPASSRHRACPVRARASRGLREHGNNRCRRGLHSHARTLRDPPLKPPSIGAVVAVDFRGLQRRVGDLWSGADPRRDAGRSCCDGMWSRCVGLCDDHPLVRVSNVRRDGDRRAIDRTCDSAGH